MHTARLLTLSPSMHCAGGAWYPSMHWGRPPREQNSWHTLLKILPCPKLRLRAVLNSLKIITSNLFDFIGDLIGVGEVGSQLTSAIPSTNFIHYTRGGPIVGTLILWDWGPILWNNFVKISQKNPIRFKHFLSIGTSEIFRSRSVIALFHATYFAKVVRNTIAPFRVERPNYPLPADLRRHWIS